MATTTSTIAEAGSDPIDVLVPPLRPWWVRLAMASVVIAAVAAIAYTWHFGVLRPSPDCCGSGSSGAQIGLSDQEGAVTVTAYFFNSSSRAVSISDAEADLPGATVVGVAPYGGPGSYQMPPENLVDFPHVVDGGGEVWLAISFVPERCSDDANDWGTLTLDLDVAGDPWYPTFGRRFRNPEAVVPAGPGGLSVLPPASLDNAFVSDTRPLEAACILLGR